MLYLLRFVVYSRRLPKFSDPRRLSDKLALRILSNRASLRRRQMADKLRCGVMVSKICPELRVKKVYAVYDSAEEFSLASLPSSFALKPNNASGMNVLVLDKAAVDERSIRKIIAQWFELDYYHITQEPSYRGIQARVFAEELTLNADDFFPFEYRLFCFQGKVAFLECEFNPTEWDGCFFVDRDWNLLPVWYKGQTPPSPMPRPASLDEAIRIAEKLSTGFDFIRVDLYDLPGGLAFSEMSSSPSGGLLVLEPDGADELLGAYWQPYTAREADRDEQDRDERD